MDYSPKVQKIQYSSDVDFFLTRPKIGIQETRLGNAEVHQPLVYIMTVLNSSLILRKSKWNSHKYSFLIIALASYPASFIISKYLFGYDKYRMLTRRDEDTRKSVEFYRDNADLKN